MDEEKDERGTSQANAEPGRGGLAAFAEGIYARNPYTVDTTDHNRWAQGARTAMEMFAAASLLPTPREDDTLAEFSAAQDWSMERVVDEKAPDLTSYGVPGGTTDQDLERWLARREITRALNRLLPPGDPRASNLAAAILDALREAGFRVVRTEGRA